MSLCQVLDLRILEKGDQLWFQASRELEGAVRREPKACESSEPDVNGMEPPPMAYQVQGRGEAQVQEGGYGWLRKANGPSDRQARRELSAATKQAVEARSYALAGQVVELRHVAPGPLAVGTKTTEDTMLQGTTLVAPHLTWPQLGGNSDAALSFERGTVLAVAVELARRGERVAAVNAASAYHAGGGFTTGGRHALEEAMCMQSSLYASLEKGMRLAEDAKITAPKWVKPAVRKDGGAWVSHLPDDGVLLSPKAGHKEGNRA